jgi:hypothetical protein
MHGKISCPFTSDIYKLLDEKNEEIIASMPSDKVETLNYIRKFIYESEKNADVDKVAETLPGIELSQFCLNLAYRRERKLEGIDTKGLGAYFFHKEIFPIVSRVKSYVDAVVNLCVVHWCRFRNNLIFGQSSI